MIAYNDLSVGETNVALISGGWNAVMHELYNQPVKEMVISSELPETLQDELREKLSITLSYQDETTFNAEYRGLCSTLNDERLVQGFSRLLNYIQKTQNVPLIICSRLG